MATGTTGPHLVAINSSISAFLAADRPCLGSTSRWQVTLKEENLVVCQAADAVIALVEGSVVIISLMEGNYEVPAEENLALILADAIISIILTESNLLVFRVAEGDVVIFLLRMSLPLS